MKILSLWQPWASLWVAGAPIAKGIETRGWGTDYRGIVAVHAAKHWDEDIAATCRTEPFKSVLASLGFNDAPMGHRASLPFGAILGYVDLVDCLRMVSPAAGFGAAPGTIDINHDARLAGHERAFGNYETGRYALVTGTQRRILATPIQFRGTQGLRDLDPAIAARIV